MNARRLLIALAVFSLTWAGASLAFAAQPYTLTDLGNIGYSSTAAAVSTVGGHVEVVGTGQETSDLAYNAWYWTPATGTVDLGSVLKSAFGATGSQATGLNSSGQIVGAYSTDTTSGNGFVYTIGGTPTRIGAPSNFVINSLSNLSDNGVVAGWGVAGSDVTVRPFTYNVNSQSFTDLYKSGGVPAEVNAINNSGWLAGQYGVSLLSAYTWNGTAWNNLGTLASKATTSYGIDANGDVVGNSPSSANKKQAFYSHYNGSGWDPMVNLGLIPNTANTASIARGINNNGQVVGYDYVSTIPATATAFLSGTTAGSQVDLSSLVANLSGWTLQQAMAIDNRCNIVGLGTDAGGTSKAFLLSALSGDANLDGIIDVADLNKVLTNYNKTGMNWSQGDFDGSGSADITDLNKVLTGYNKTVASSAGPTSVPEPATSALLATLLALAAVRMRRLQVRPL